MSAELIVGAVPKGGIPLLGVPLYGLPYGQANAVPDAMTGAARWITEPYVVKLTSDADHVEKP